VDDYEDEQRRREQLWREIQASGDYDAWEEFVRSEATDRPARHRDADTA
jgi:hypothetical protein